MGIPKYLHAASTSEYMTTDEAADFLNVKPTVIRNYLAEGKLQPYKFKTLTLLKVDELKEWKATRSRR